MTQVNDDEGRSIVCAHFPKENDQANKTTETTIPVVIDLIVDNKETVTANLKPVPRLLLNDDNEINLEDKELIDLSLDHEYNKPNHKESSH